jgi:hypothetical protein
VQYEYEFISTLLRQLLIHFGFELETRQFLQHKSLHKNKKNVEEIKVRNSLESISGSRFRERINRAQKFIGKHQQWIKATR